MIFELGGGYLFDQPAGQQTPPLQAIKQARLSGSSWGRKRKIAAEH
jgi:hypothetical protein